ncbi:hypothetical protein H696_03208 [Fonticula alba]|uniref:Uncharacterized protein n=1 Tax=Fonticula alba TaxID=691883 RepID=A0A058ZBP8_FONAL|nr:hypothetical protein H696_03208 [Fonticula alba]KCV70852.1 hypothetical protein H696_03208 [Fonticula alba]|eukprot:XP_009495368.1 hypothetical protein H696_03208 [Fonticula alba]
MHIRDALAWPWVQSVNQNSLSRCSPISACLLYLRLFLDCPHMQPYPNSPQGPGVFVSPAPAAPADPSWSQPAYPPSGSGVPPSVVAAPTGATPPPGPGYPPVSPLAMGSQPAPHAAPYPPGYHPQQGEAYALGPVYVGAPPVHDLQADSVPSSGPDPKAYLPYYETPQKRPTGLNKASWVVPVILASIIFVGGLGVFFFGVATVRENVFMVGVGLGIMAMGLAMGLGFFFLFRKMNRQFERRLAFDAQAADIIRAGGKPDLAPYVLVCKFCRAIRRNKRIVSVVCDRPPHVLVPPTLACIDSVTASQREDLIMQLRHGNHR